MHVLHLSFKVSLFLLLLTTHILEIDTRNDVIVFALLLIVDRGFVDLWISYLKLIFVNNKNNTSAMNFVR